MPHPQNQGTSSVADATFNELESGNDLTARLVFCLLIGFLSAPIFAAFHDVASDNYVHTAMAAALWDGGTDWPPNFLYFWLLGLFGRLIGDTTELELSTIILLSCAVALKAFLTMHLFKELAPRVTFPVNAAATAVLLFSFAFPVTYVLALNINYHLGNITPNIWHNSTTIFLMPFALGAFIAQARDLESGSTRNVALISVLVVTGLLVKPSYFFAYAPATALWLALWFRYMDRPLRAALPIVLGCGFTLLIYLSLYHLQQGTIYDGTSGVAIGLLSVWDHYVPAKYIPISLLSSFLAPLLYLALGLHPSRSTWILYALFHMIAGLLLFAVFKETGPREGHGNFSWQTIICAYLLHAVVIADLLQKWTTGQRDWRIASCAAAYLGMFLSGLVYLFRIVALDVTWTF